MTDLSARERAALDGTDEAAAKIIGRKLDKALAFARPDAPPRGFDGSITQVEFGPLVNQFLIDCQDMLLRKNAQYAQGDDPLANFRETAKFLNTGMLEALAPHLHKHYRSLMSNLVHSSVEEAREHCIDITNYLAFIMVIKTELARRKEST